jgi:5-hydroxyisourate hydrolase
VNAGLTTHVLDTTSEGPADGVEVTLQRIGPDSDAEPVASGTTNDDGRLDEPVLAANETGTRTCQLLFEVGAYYREGPTGSTFLETVPVRFVIDDTGEHYHVPLLVSPGGYTTYRGS